MTENTERIIDDLIDRFTQRRTDPWVRHQELRVNDLETLRRLIPAAPKPPHDAGVNLQNQFFGFPIITDDTLPRDVIQLRDIEGTIVRQWRIA